MFSRQDQNGETCFNKAQDAELYTKVTGKWPVVYRVVSSIIKQYESTDQITLIIQARRIYAACLGSCTWEDFKFISMPIFTTSKVHTVRKFHTYWKVNNHSSWRSIANESRGILRQNTQASRSGPSRRRKEVMRNTELLLNTLLTFDSYFDNSGRRSCY